MKSKVLLIVLVSFMIMGVVSAASLWGSYKGNPIIKVNIDGKQNKYTGVPSISYGGQVMLPINTLKSLGVTYKYDSKTLTANITKPIQSNLSDTTKLKTYAEFGRFFAKLENLGDEFLYLDKNFFITVLALPTNAKDNLDSSLKELTRVIDAYNEMVDPTNTYTAIMNENGFYTAAQDVQDIMKNYYDTIDFYKLAFASLEAYNSDKDFANKFFNHIRNATEKFDNGYKLAKTNFEVFQTLIQEYKTSSASVTDEPQNTSQPIVIQPSTSTTVESRIEDDFNGFEYGNIYKLDNGQLWKQVSYEIKVSYKYRPKVTIYKDGMYYYMIVDGVDKKVKVELIK